MFSTRRFAEDTLGCRPRLLFTTDGGNGGGGSDPVAPADDAGVDAWKAFSRKWEGIAKSKPDVTKEELAALRARPEISQSDLDDLRTKAARVDKADDDKKTEIEKLTERLEAAESKVAAREAKDAEDAKKSELKAIAEEVAKTKGVPADALRGASKEELEAHADTLAPLVKKPAAPGTGGQGEGEAIGDGELSADDVVKAATGK